jgi:sporulation protein YlmC with PRC-barrel domain
MHIMKTLFATSALALLLATGASAQTATPAPAARPATAPAMAGQPVTSAMLGTQVWKQAVYDNTGTRIGEIDDMVVSNTGQINEALIGVGGFLGIGEKTVAIPYASLRPMADGSRVWYVLDQTKEQLTAAPAFDYKAYKK